MCQNYHCDSNLRPSENNYYKRRSSLVVLQLACPMVKYRGAEVKAIKLTEGKSFCCLPNNRYDLDLK